MNTGEHPVNPELSLLLRAMNDRIDQVKRALSQSEIAAFLARQRLTEYEPRQSIKGLDRCADALLRIRRTLLMRTVLQDHLIHREQIKEDCDEVLRVIAGENPIAKPEPLPRVDFRTITPDAFFENYVRSSQACVIDNVCQAPERYTLSALIERYGHEPVPLQKIGDGSFFEAPLGELLKGESYLANSDRLFVNHPELLTDLKFEVFSKLTRLRQISAQFFISAKGAGSPAHFGKIANTFYQLEGMKRWSLVDPAFLYLLYPILLPGDSASALHWLDESDYERCPLFKYCPRYEVTLEPGNVLWNPYYWFHSVKNVTKESVAVAVRWYGTPGKDFLSPLPLYDLATTLCPQSIDIDTFIRWIVIGDTINKTKSPWYEQVSHGRRYSAFDSGYNAKAWGVEPPDLRSGLLKHES
jgi:hypothetical protein